jgi:hypothetical protein
MTLLEQIHSNLECVDDLLDLLIEHVFQSMGEGRFKDVDALLRDVDPSRTNLIYPIGLLRASFTFHLDLPHWSTLRDRCVAYTTEQGLNTEELLVGLLDTSWFTLPAEGHEVPDSVVVPVGEVNMVVSLGEVTPEVAQVMDGLFRKYDLD